MKDSSTRSRSRLSSDEIPSGLSRRSWIMLAAGTAVVMVVLAIVAVGAIASLFGQGHGDASAAQESAPRIPRAEPPFTPLGLPPRPTPTQVQTVPSRPVDSLKTGDCLQLYPSKWADAYPVIDCAQHHIAQLLSRGVLPQAADAPYPGADALDKQVLDLCGAPDLIDWHWVAVWGEDVQIDLRYPNSAEQWAAGSRSYYCFVYTFSRHELTGSAVPSG